MRINVQPVQLAQLEYVRDIGGFHKTMLGGDAEEALLQTVEIDFLFIWNVGNVLGTDGQQDYPLVQHSVMLEVHLQTMGHAEMAGGHENGRAGHSRQSRVFL